MFLFFIFISDPLTTYARKLKLLREFFYTPLAQRSYQFDAINERVDESLST